MEKQLRLIRAMKTRACSFRLRMRWLMVRLITRKRLKTERVSYTDKEVKTW